MGFFVFLRAAADEVVPIGKVPGVAEGGERLFVQLRQQPVVVILFAGGAAVLFRQQGDQGGLPGVGVSGDEISVGKVHGFFSYCRLCFFRFQASISSRMESISSTTSSALSGRT